MSEIDLGSVSVSKQDRIATITFEHPKSNSLPRKLLEKLAMAIEETGADADVRVVVIRSSGNRAFCAGASFDEFLAIETLEESTRFFSGFAKVLLAIRSCPAFVICRVQGKVVGGGVGLVSACDYAIATEAAAIRLSELAIGIGPFTISPAVIRKVGLPAFNELAIDADWRDAAWSERHGLYVSVVTDTEALDAAVNARAKALADFNPDAMRELKALLWAGTEDWPTILAERVSITARLMLSDFVREKVSSLRNNS
ncbi:MAG: enoyl-CoA hydratase/isomerase family protein [Bdellovibrionales bacterium]|nr:enoyl-CoA hydratase/isomerase family protein [Bdellovibrionales bacterium]